MKNPLKKLFRGTFFFSSEEETARSLSTPTMNESGRALKERGKVIRDPVHGLISLRPDELYLLELIDTQEFQRLRRIRQLGVSNITYPGAEHTRFAHSLGVLSFAGRILDHLKSRYLSHKEIFDLIQKHERTIKAAALLHDTGHGPFEPCDFGILTSSTNAS